MSFIKCPQCGYEEISEGVRNTRLQIENIRRDIKRVFTWANTPQGFDYWIRVCDNLEDLSHSYSYDE